MNAPPTDPLSILRRIEASAAMGEYMDYAELKRLVADIQKWSEAAITVAADPMSPVEVEMHI